MPEGSPLPSKVGGIPTLPLIGLGAILGFFLYTRNKSAQTATVDAGTNTMTAAPYSSVGTGPGGWTYQQPQAAGPTGPTTNQQWALAVEKLLIGQGYNPTTVDNAVRKYLAGSQLSAGENTLIALALQLMGPAPETMLPAPDPVPVTPINTNPPVTPRPPMPPAPSLPGNIMQLMIANGEHIVDEKPSAKGGWIFLTNKGGIYNVGSPYYGSAYGATKTEFGRLIPLRNGGYEAIDNNGQSYVFGS